MPTSQPLSRLPNVPPFHSHPPRKASWGRNAERAASMSGLGGALLDGREADVGPRVEGLGFERRHRLGGPEDWLYRVEHEHGVERRSDQIVQTGARDGRLGSCLDVALAHGRGVDVDREHVGLRRRADLIAVAGSPGILGRGLDAGSRGVGERLEQQNAAVGVDGLRRELLFGLLPPQRGGLAAELRGPNRRPDGAVEDDLLDRQGGAEVVEGIGIVQGREVEILRGEPPLREQAAEREHRQVAPLPGLGRIDARVQRRPRLRRPSAPPRARRCPRPRRSGAGCAPAPPPRRATAAPGRRRRRERPASASRSRTSCASSWMRDAGFRDW